MGRQADPGSNRAAAVLALVVVTAVWGATFPLVQNGIEGIPTFQFLFVRFALATLLLVPASLRGGGLRGLLEPLAIAPGLFLAAGYTLQTEGLRTVSPSISAFLTSTSVVFVPLACGLLGWERLTLRLGGALLLAFGGIFLLQGMRIPSHWARGETLTLFCALAFAGQIILTGRHARRISPAAFTGTQMLVATVAFGIMAARGGLAGAEAGWTREASIAAAFTGVFATALAFLVQTWAQRRIPAAEVAIIFSMEPLFAALVSMSFYGDRLGASGWVGGAAVLAGTVLASIQPTGGAGRRSPER